MPRLQGKTTTAATTESAIYGTAYTEPTTGAQRSISSGSALDAVAGTGAQQVRITYFTLDASGNVAGPYAETVTMNGTTAVNTVATNIALVEKMEVVRAGSTGAAGGTITLYAITGGGGGIIGSILGAETQTHWGHHYIASGRRVVMTDVVMANSSASTTATVGVRSLAYGVVGAVEQILTEALSPKGQFGSQIVTFAENSQPPISGPARLRVYVTAGDAASQVTRVDLGYVEE